MQPDVLQPVGADPAMDPAVGLIRLDQVPVAGGAMRAQIAQQLHSLQQVGLTCSVGANNNDPAGLHLQGRLVVAAKMLELQPG